MCHHILGKSTGHVRGPICPFHPPEIFFTQLAVDLLQLSIALKTKSRTEKLCPKEGVCGKLFTAKFDVVK